MRFYSLCPFVKTLVSARRRFHSHLSPPPRCSIVPASHCIFGPGRGSCITWAELLWFYSANKHLEFTQCRVYACASWSSRTGAPYVLRAVFVETRRRTPRCGASLFVLTHPCRIKTPSIIACVLWITYLSSGGDWISWKFFTDGAVALPLKSTRHDESGSYLLSLWWNTSRRSSCRRFCAPCKFEGDAV